VSGRGTVSGQIRLDVAPDIPGRSLTGPDRQATVVLGVYVLTLFVFPSDTVVRVIGAQGFVAGIVALVLLAAWAVAVLLGIHDPLAVRNPTRAALAWLAATSLACWALTPFNRLTPVQALAADRWIMLVAAGAGVALVAAEGIRTRAALVAVLRLTVAGGAFCALVAVLQWVLALDLSAVLRQALPGFSTEGLYSAYQSRGALQRVTGTTLHPIELGVVAGMLLPVALTLAMHDRRRSALRRWVPVGLIALAIPASVSRSAMLAVVVAMTVFVLCLPARPRVSALVLLPLGAFVVVLSRRGYVRTLLDLVGEGSDDASVAARLDDYPMVEALVEQRPWFGTGGGTYMPADAFDILDNQFLKSAIELGVIGMSGLLAWFLVPVVTALVARHRSSDPLLRAAAAALAGALLAGAIASATFDSLSFNTYAGVHALLTGCAGACWIMARREQTSTTLPTPTSSRS
jgi:O-antigen ligase